MKKNGEEKIFELMVEWIEKEREREREREDY